MNTTQKESKNISPERADAFVRNVMLVLFLCRDGRPTCLWLWMRRHAGRRVRSNTFEFNCASVTLWGKSFNFFKNEFLSVQSAFFWVFVSGTIRFYPYLFVSGTIGFYPVWIKPDCTRYKPDRYTWQYSDTSRGVHAFGSGWETQPLFTGGGRSVEQSRRERDVDL